MWGRIRDRFHFKPAQSTPGDSPPPWAIVSPENTILVLLLLIELWLFSGAFQRFFAHDGLFYMTHVPQSWGQFQQYLLAPSDEKSYRPLNLGFIALVRPILGLDPHPYHWIPIAFHLLNTVLFFFLAKRLLANSTAVLAATAFWGLHSVAGWITYDITYLSDFLLAFLLLLSLLLAVEGRRRKSRLLIAGSLGVYVLSLLTKEAATTFPLVFWISLALADLRTSQEPVTRKQIGHAFRKAIPLTFLYLLVAIAFAGLFVHWLRAGLIYAQGSSAAYNISPWANLAAKTKYIYWAFNLPDALSIPNAARDRALALGLMGFVLLIWSLDILRRRGRLLVVEWAGIVWFVGLSVPALLLSTRLAKWYLYLPLFGLALAFGVLCENLQALAPVRLRRSVGFVILGLLIVPVLFSSIVQTQSYIAASDSAYQSDLLESCLHDFQEAHPALPPQATLFFLPTFEEGVANLLSVPPIDHGELFGLYYPGTRLQAMFAHKGARLPDDIGNRSDVYVLQYLDHHLYDVTDFFKSTGRMTLYLLPTFEGKAAPLLKKEPAGGRKLYQEYVQTLFADEGARLPEDYYKRPDLWILQYLNGRFSDVTDYSKGRRRDDARRVIQGLEGIQYSVNHAEYYPDYQHFDTPTGAPVFFPTPGKEILTQIGGSTVICPLHKIPGGSRLLFDVSWMFEQGDGGWAEAVLRSQGRESVVYRAYMQPDSKRKSLLWKEVSIDLKPFENEEADLILKCYNDPGKKTVADWLNWRDIVIEPKR